MTTTAALRTLAADRRVRVFFGGKAVVDTRDPLLVWTGPVPVYYFPSEDVDTGLLVDPDPESLPPGVGAVPSQEARRRAGTGAGSLGDPRFWTVRVGEREAVGAAWEYPDAPEVAGRIALRWNAMDAWFEEDEEVFVHPRDPFHRVDVLRSSRHVEVVVGGVKVADSHRPTLLFETGLPTRYYLPKTDVRMELLTPTDSVTECPYKGNADYWSVTAGGETFEDIVWGYHPAVHESAKIDGLVCFYNENVDLYVDGELQERPQTFWS